VVEKTLHGIPCRDDSPLHDVLTHWHTKAEDQDDARVWDMERRLGTSTC